MSQNNGRPSTLAALLIVPLLLSACATQRFTLQAGEDMPTLHSMSQFFVDGIAQTDHINAADICGSADQVAAIETQVSAIDVLLRVMTWGLYTPKDYKVYCTR